MVVVGAWGKVVYLLAKKRYQAGVGQTKGTNRKTLAEACEDAVRVRAARSPSGA